KAEKSGKGTRGDPHHFYRVSAQPAVPNTQGLGRNESGTSEQGVSARKSTSCEEEKSSPPEFRSNPVSEPGQNPKRNREQEFGASDGETHPAPDPERASRQAEIKFRDYSNGQESKQAAVVAKDLIDRLEEAGVIGPANGSGPRPVLHMGPNSAVADDDEY